jgi:hypothetical protein
MNAMGITTGMNQAKIELDEDHGPPTLTIERNREDAHVDSFC